MGNNWDNNVCLIEFHSWQWQTGLFQSNIPTKINQKNWTIPFYSRKKRSHGPLRSPPGRRLKVSFSQLPWSLAIRKGWKTKSVPSPPAPVWVWQCPLCSFNHQKTFRSVTALKGKWVCNLFLHVMVDFYFFTRTLFCLNPVFCFCFCFNPVYLYPESTSYNKEPGRYHLFNA